MPTGAHPLARSAAYDNAADVQPPPPRPPPPPPPSRLGFGSRGGLGLGAGWGLGAGFRLLLNDATRGCKRFTSAIRSVEFIQ